MVLLVLDVQRGITNDGLFAFDTFCSNLDLLINEARENGVEVIYVRHDDGPDSGFSKGDEDFEIYQPLEPKADEKIFDKTVNSAFHKSVGLVNYLKKRAEKQIMLVGLQTEFCMDATVKSGFEHGFEMFVPEYSNSTFDNDYFSGELGYKLYNEFMWPNRYAKCVSIEKAVELLKSADCLKSDINDLLNNLDKLSTTELGAARIKKNLNVETEDIVSWCKKEILSEDAVITRNGKNWYVNVNGNVFTVNGSRYTIITARKGR